MAITLTVDNKEQANSRVLTIFFQLCNLPEKFSMSQIHHVEFKELPVALIDEDPQQPRSSKNTATDVERLQESLQALGMQQPIAVTKTPDGRFKVIDGHRRLKCAKQIQKDLVDKGGRGWETLHCRVYPELDPGELERIRFELQNNRRPWKPLERAVALARIKESTHSKTNKEVADLLFISETQVSNALTLNKQSDEYQVLMEEYDLSDSYRTEFGKLRPKLRPIREFDIDTIIRIIFDKVKYRQATSAKDFRTLGHIFLRATANQNYIHDFLANQDMTVKELEDSTVQSGFSLWVDQIIAKMKTNERHKTPFTSQEKVVLSELKRLLDKHLSS